MNSNKNKTTQNVRRRPKGDIGSAINKIRKIFDEELQDPSEQVVVLNTISAFYRFKGTIVRAYQNDPSEAMLSLIERHKLVLSSAIVSKIQSKI